MSKRLDAIKEVMPDLFRVMKAMNYLVTEEEYIDPNEIFDNDFGDILKTISDSLICGGCNSIKAKSYIKVLLRLAYIASQLPKMGVNAVRMEGDDIIDGAFIEMGEEELFDDEFTFKDLLVNLTRDTSTIKYIGMIADELERIIEILSPKNMNDNWVRINNPIKNSVLVDMYESFYNNDCFAFEGFEKEDSYGCSLKMLRPDE